MEIQNFQILYVSSSERSQWSQVGTEGTEHFLLQWAHALYLEGKREAHFVQSVFTLQEGSFLSSPLPGIKNSNVHFHVKSAVRTKEDFPCRNKTNYICNADLGLYRWFKSLKMSDSWKINC